MKPAIALAAALIALSAPASALAQTSPTPAPGPARSTASVLSLSAWGESRVAPDLASVSVGVTTHAGSAVEAMRQNASRMNALLAAVKQAGVASADVQTTEINLFAEYANEQGQAPRVTGYQASNSVSVTVRDLSRLGAVIDAASGAGGNQVSGVSFGLKDRQAAEDTARVDAVRRLQAKAELYARALGRRLGPLQSFSEGSANVSQPPRPMMMAARVAQASTPTSAGELNLHVDVEGIWTLEP